MIVNFYPWEMDIDVEATRQFYEENDCSEDKSTNHKFCDPMTLERIEK